MISFAYRFNLYKSSAENVKDEMTAINALFGDDLNLLTESKKEINEILDNAVKKITCLSAYKKAFCDKTIVFFGDSLTSDKLGYRSIIDKCEIFKETVDRSVSGSSSSDCFKAIARETADKRYDYAVIFIGTNDSMIFNGVPLADGEIFYRYLRKAAEILTGKGIKVKLFNVPFSEYNESFESTSEINKAIKRVSDEFGLDVFDVNGFFKGKKCHEQDGIHLTPTAQLALCEKFLKWLYIKNEKN